MRKFLFLLAVAVSVPLAGACTKSVERAQRDVQRAHNQAAQDIRDKQADLDATKRDAADRIAKQERRVEDAAREANEKITKEQRELEDAKREKARRENDSSAIDRTSTTEPPTRVDINVNRGPGVQVDVNRNP
jgi:hypothetical protein